jgi:hypothetical protein
VRLFNGCWKPAEAIAIRTPYEPLLPFMSEWPERQTETGNDDSIRGEQSRRRNLPDGTTHDEHILLWL